MRAALFGLALAATACDSARTRPLIDGDPIDARAGTGSADGGHPADAGTTAGDASAADGSAGGRDAGGYCGLSSHTVSSDGFEYSEPRVDGSRVYLHRRGADGQLGVVDAEADTRIGGPGDLLRDVRGGAFLLLRSDGGSGRRLIYRDADGDVALDEQPVVPLAEVPPPQAVAPRAAAWVAQGIVRRWTDGQRTDLSRGNLAHASQDDGWTTWLDLAQRRVGVAGPDGGVRFLGEGVRGVPVHRRGHVWWLDDAGRVVHARVSGNVDLRELGDCQALDADGPRALAVCSDAGEQQLVLVEIGGDGDARLSVIDAAATITGVRIRDRDLAWATYDDPDAWCLGQGRGTLKWWPRGEPEPIAITGVGAGCGCCGAYWPPLMIDLGDDVIAWNYAGARNAPAIGIARRRCE